MYSMELAAFAALLKAMHFWQIGNRWKQVWCCMCSAAFVSSIWTLKSTHKLTRLPLVPLLVKTPRLPPQFTFFYLSFCITYASTVFTYLLNECFFNLWCLIFSCLLEPNSMPVRQILPLAAALIDKLDAAFDVHAAPGVRHHLVQVHVPPRRAVVSRRWVEEKRLGFGGLEEEECKGSSSRWRDYSADGVIYSPKLRRWIGCVRRYNLYSWVFDGGRTLARQVPWIQWRT